MQARQAMQSMKARDILGCSYTQVFIANDSVIRMTDSKNAGMISAQSHNTICLHCEAWIFLLLKSAQVSGIEMLGSTFSIPP